MLDEVAEKSPQQQLKVTRQPHENRSQNDKPSPSS
jgi:hypothetical protein